MKTVEYKFDMDDAVSTPFGEAGIVTMLGYDEGGNKYYVQTANSAGWFKEGQLTRRP